MLSPAEEEVDAQVRREDQENINRFARLNARLHQINQDVDRLKKDLERLDDASTDLMMLEEEEDDDDDVDELDDTNHRGRPTLSSANVWLTMGESFFSVKNVEEATEYCEAQLQILQQQLERLQAERQDILQQQDELKKVLYGRFGKSINLEEAPVKT